MDPTLPEQAAPFLVAGAAGILLALFELYQAFQRDVGAALLNRWAWLLLFLNAAAATVSYAVVGWIQPELAGSFGTAFLVGITFPAVVRSRFTFYRNPREAANGQLSEISLPFDQMYTTIQNGCLEEVNLSLADQRSTWARVIALSDYDIARSLEELIQAGKLPDLRAEHEKKLASIQAKYETDPAKLRHMLALLLIDLMPRRRIRALVRQHAESPAPAAVAPVA